jgi:Tfp pilus assembly ATPase PilU
MIEFFPALKQPQIRSILAGVLRGVISQRLLPRADGGRVAAVEVMVTNSRIADLVRESRADEITEAIADGAYYDMQTFTQALIGLVLDGSIDRDTAANAATSRHDFLVALEHAVKQQEADQAAAQAAIPFAREDSSPQPAPEQVAHQMLPPQEAVVEGLRVVRSTGT